MRSNLKKFVSEYYSNWLLVFVLSWLTVYVSMITEPLSLARQNWIFIFVGFFSAIIGNITAIGGGIVFIPVMIFIFHLSPLVALKVAIVSQCFGMTSGAIAWTKKQKIPKLLFYYTIPGLILGTLVSSLIFKPKPLLIKGLFGPVSIFLGFLILLHALKQNNGPNLEKGYIEKLATNLKSKFILLSVSFLGGLITGWIAIGEGEIVASYLMYFQGLSAHLSIAFGVVLLSINSLVLCLIHVLFLDGIPWEIGLFTGLGCVFGARLAPLIATKINTKWIKIVFSFIAIADGLIFIYQFMITP